MQQLRIRGFRFVFSGVLIGLLSLALDFGGSRVCAEDAVGDSGKRPQVTLPPESYFAKVREKDREAARAFYKKFIDIGGLACTAGADVADAALIRTHEIVTHMLADRPDILQAMADNGTRLIIIGKDQVYTDMPEYRNHPNPEFQNERVRGTGGFDVTSFGEENLLNLALDRYDDESIAVHEFCHTIDAALRRIDKTWSERMTSVYRNAVEQGRYKFAYAGSNAGEYWAEIAQAYFDCNRVNNWNHSAIGTREQLKDYDPEGYELVRETFKLSPQNDWRFSPMQKQPSVIEPPAKFAFPEFYTKFTWAREFPVLGSAKVNEEAMLIANDTIRKMFAYRHDLLKVLINDKARVVVLAKGERLTDLPEFADEREQARPAMARHFDYTADKKVIVVPEENLLGGTADPAAGRCLLVGQMAKAVYTVAAAREVDERYLTVRRDSQQYEQRLIWDKSSERIPRMDVQFDLRMREVFAEAAQRGLWRGTPAARSPVEYWATGVEAYFDAAGLGYPPVDAPRPVTNREELKAYDPALFKMVDETMLYDGHQDWRYRRK